MRLRTLAMAAAGLSCASFGAPPWWKAFDKQVIKRIEITGYRRVGFHAHTVQGDREAFDTVNYYGQGQKTLTDVGEIRLTGRNVFGLVNFQATVLDSRLTDPQGQKFTIDYNRDGWQASYGDVMGTLLNTNRFAAFSRSLKGVTLGYRKGRAAFKTLRSEAKGSARTVSIAGNNSAGPYYLQNSQIVIGSEQIQVDGQTQTIGRDYSINYEVGSITFLNRVIPLTSVIVASYEAYGFNEQRGVIQGAGASYDMGKAGRFGLTYMEQQSRGGGSASTRLEKFQGFGAPSTPYFLQFEPADNFPITVRVDGVVQIPNVDYRFDADNTAVFYMNRFVPATSTVDVLYTPKPRGTVQGDRENWGIDYLLPLGKSGRNGSIQLSQAVGRLKSAVSPLKGLARGATFNYRDGGFEATLNARDIPSGYTSVETRGFNRNERAHDFSLAYQPFEGLNARLLQSNAAIQNRTTNPDGSTSFIPSRFSRLRGELEIGSGDDLAWDVSQQRTHTRTLVGLSQLDSTELAANPRIGSTQWRFSLERQQGFAPLSSGDKSRLNVVSARARSGYSWKRLSLDGSLAFSEVKVDGEKSAGKDFDLNARYAANRALRFGARYALSDSGALGALGGFSSGFGLGYGGNGFSSGSGSDSSTGTTNTQAYELTADWTPFERLNVDAHVNGWRATGSVSSNSETHSFGAGAAWDIGRSHTLAFAIDRSRTSYVESALKSSATTISAFLDARPPGRWTYSLGGNWLLSGGGSSVQQDSAWLSGSVSYLLAARQSLSLDVNGGTTRGYLPQNSLDTGLTYSYQIWRNLALNASYRLRDVKNTGSTTTSGAYRSSGFDLELAFNFGR